MAITLHKTNIWVISLSIWKQTSWGGGVINLYIMTKFQYISELRKLFKSTVFALLTSVQVQKLKKKKNPRQVLLNLIYLHFNKKSFHSHGHTKKWNFSLTHRGLSWEMLKIIPMTEIELWPVTVKKNPAIQVSAVE